MLKIKRLLFGLFTILLTVVIFLVIMEVIMRVFFPISTYGFSKGMFQKNEALDYSLTPNFTGTHKGADFLTKVSINSRGLRDDEHNISKDYRKRILIIGDSYTFGSGVEFNQTFSYLLEQKLKDVEIIKAGIPGYGTDNEYLFLKNNLIKYNPDVVMVVYSLNDIFDNMQQGEYTVDDGFLVLNKASASSQKPIVKVHRWILRKSMVYNFFYQSTRKLLNGVVKSAQGTDESTDFSPYLKENSDIYNNELAKTLSYLQDIKRVSDSIDAKMTLVVVAHKNNLFPEIIKEYEAYAKTLGDEVDVDKLGNDLKKFALDNNVSFIDLNEGFRKEDFRKLFLPIDGHWNALGHKKASELIYESLIKANIVM